MRLLFLAIIGVFVFYLLGGSVSGLSDKLRALLSGTGITINIGDAVEYGKESMESAADRAAKIKAGVQAIHSGSVMIREGMRGGMKGTASGEMMVK